LNNSSPVGIAKPAFSLWWREVIRFLRQRSRVFGALGQPLIFWLLLGAGLGGMFQLPASMEDMTYLEYLFPGILALVVLFTAIFSTISIIEDRKSGFLQSVLVAPISRSSIVLGKIAGGTFLAMLQVVLLCAAIPFLGIPITGWAFLELFAELLVIAFALTGLGYVIAWPMDSTQGFHSIMNVLLIPMWLLSGAFFPAEGLPAWLSWIMVVNPLTYGMNIIRGTLYGEIHPMAVSWIVTIGFAMVTFTTAVILTHRREQGS